MNFQQLEFQPRAGGSSLAARLRREVEGDVLFDRASRGRYATDASIYQVEPVGVVVPKSEADALRAMQIAIDAGVPVLPRGAGTSQCGQTVGAALVIDNSKHLGGIIEFDPAQRHRHGAARHRARHAQRLLRPHGLWFPVDVSTSAQATIGGMAGNNSCGSRSIRYGNMVHNVLADRRGARRRRGVPVRAERRDGERSAGVSRAGGRDPRDHPPRGGRDRGALADRAAAGAGLQPRHACSPHRSAQPGPPADRLRGHARLLAPAHAQARAAAGAQDARRVPLPDVLRRR